jgi:hypothetical protein
MDMKKTSIVGILALLLIFLSHVEAPAAPGDVGKKIEQAARVLLGDSASREEIVQALIQIIDCAAALSEESRYTEEIRTQLGIAKNEFSQKSLFSDKGRQKLAFAYRMLTNGQKYQTPRELDDFVTPDQAMEKARIYAGKLVKRALEDYKAGNHPQSAKKLVELALMIVTPMSGTQDL